MRAVDTIRRLALPGVDADSEAAAITRAEIVDLDGVDAIAGATAFLASLPGERWAIVTSAPRALAEARLGAAGIALPAVMVTAEDVTIGKPNPACYRLAADRLGFDVRDCLIFEDAPAGIQAAEAAGAAVAVVTATHAHAIETSHASFIDFTDLRCRAEDAGLRLAQVALNQG